MFLESSVIHVINSLAPVFLIIALGATLRRFGWMPPAMAQWASELTYWVALPALLLVVTADTQIDFAQHADA
jgi:predicted permease